MLIDPESLRHDLYTLEEIEKASNRLVTQAMLDFREDADDIFQHEIDRPQDFAEDITREALDRIGVSRIDQRLFGTIDYKRARYLFHPEYAVRQALFVDSKAEKGDAGTATLQTSQTSMRIRHVRGGAETDQPGTLPPCLDAAAGKFLTTTILVKFAYEENVSNGHTLKDMTVVAVPSGWLQERYNPTCAESIWRAGRNAPSRGENFRVRLVFKKLQEMARWRVQRIPVRPPDPFAWSE